MAGGLNAHPNPFVEAWATKREHIEKTFRWTPKSLGLIALFGVGLPLWIYKTQIYEFVSARPRRLGGLHALRGLARGGPQRVVGCALALRNLNAHACADGRSRTLRAQEKNDKRLKKPAKSFL